MAEVFGILADTSDSKNYDDFRVSLPEDEP
jgi:hypothetical protein